MLDLASVLPLACVGIRYLRGGAARRQLRRYSQPKLSVEQEASKSRQETGLMCQGNVTSFKALYS